MCQGYNAKPKEMVWHVKIRRRIPDPPQRFSCPSACKDTRNHLLFFSHPTPAIMADYISLGTPGDVYPSCGGHGTLEILEVIKILKSADIPCCVVGISALRYFGADRFERCEYSFMIQTGGRI
jgi:hypothetical protein